MSEKIRVVILDDHQTIVDGYCYRLSLIPQIEVMTTLKYGEELEPALTLKPANVLLLDVYVPTASNNPNPYPVLHLIPRLLQIYPALNILMISMTAERGMIRAVMDAGASGYLLKDDHENIQNLGNIVVGIASGGIYFSPQVQDLLMRSQAISDGKELTQKQVAALSLCLAYPDDLTNELANKMGIANSTLRNLLSGAYLKLGVSTRVAAVEKARERGLITLPQPFSPAGFDAQE